MLQQQTYKKDDVLVFKMPTGEEVLAKLIEDTMSVFRVSKPATLRMVQQENGEVGVDFQISLLGADRNTAIDIHKSGVLMVSKARKDLRDAYVQATTGIHLAPAGILDGSGN